MDHTICDLRRTNRRRGILAVVAGNIPLCGIPSAQSKYIPVPNLLKTTGRQILSRIRSSQGDYPTGDVERILTPNELSQGRLMIVEVSVK